MRFTTELPRQRTPWLARLLALALGTLGPLALAVSARTPSRVPSHERPGADERVVAVGLPPRLPEPAPTLRESTLPSHTAGTGAPTAPTRDLVSPGTSMATSSPSASADTSAGGDAAARPRVPGARELLGSPVGGRALCLPSCGPVGPAVVAGAGGRAGAAVVSPPMSRAERDSIARAVIAAAAAAGGGQRHPAGSLPDGVAGVSIAVGLPGGGPSRAQRERTRALDADVATRLARIRARADSLAVAHRRDSIAAAGAPTGVSETAPDA